MPSDSTQFMEFLGAIADVGAEGYRDLHRDRLVSADRRRRCRRHRRRGRAVCSAPWHDRNRRTRQAQKEENLMRAAYRGTGRWRTPETPVRPADHRSYPPRHDGRDPDARPAIACLRELDADRDGGGARRGGSRHHRAPAHSADVRARGSTAPAAGAVSSVSGPVRHLHRPVPSGTVGSVRTWTSRAWRTKFRLSVSMPRLLYVKTRHPSEKRGSPP